MIKQYPLLFILCTCLWGVARAQSKSNVSLHYAASDVSSNISILYHYQLLRNWSVYAGVKYLINNPWEPKASEDIFLTQSVSNIGYKDLYANEASDHYGMRAGIERYFTIKQYPYTKLFCFYDFQYAKAIIGVWGFGNVGGSYEAKYGFNGVKNALYKHGPAFSTEHYIGIGIHSRLYSNFYYRAYVGVGRRQFKTVEYDATPGHVNRFYDVLNTKNPGKMYGIALEYNFGNKAANKPQPIPAKNNAPKLGITYNDVHAGINLSAVYLKPLAKWNAYAGIKFINNIPPRTYTTRFSSSYKNIFAQTLDQRLGLKLGVERPIAIGRQNNTELYPFIDIQATRALIRYNDISLLTEDDTYGRVYELAGPKARGPITMLEAYLGLGLRTALSNRINFKVFGGAGPVYFSAPEYDVKYPGIAMQDNKQLRLGRTFGTGIEYNLKK